MWHWPWWSDCRRQAAAGLFTFSCLFVFSKNQFLQPFSFQSLHVYRHINLFLFTSFILFVCCWTTCVFMCPAVKLRQFIRNHVCEQTDRTRTKWWRWIRYEGETSANRIKWNTWSQISFSSFYFVKTQFSYIYTETQRGNSRQTCSHLHNRRRTINKQTNKQRFTGVPLRTFHHLRKTLKSQTEGMWRRSFSVRNGNIFSK